MSNTIKAVLYIALKEELTYFREIANNISYIYQRTDSERCPYYEVHCINGDMIHLDFLCGNEMGPGNARSHVSEYLNNNKCDIVSNLGIAGAISPDVKVGDIIVPSQVDNYLENAKFIDNENSYGINFSGEVSQTNYALRTSIINAQKNGIQWINKWQKSCVETSKRAIENTDNKIPDKALSFINLQPNIHVGHLATGPAVVASEQFKKWILKNRDRKLLGIEMEAAGVATACSEVGGLYPVPFIAFKAISDTANEEVKRYLDSFEEGFFRKTGVENATRLLFEFLRTTVADLFTKNSKQKADSRLMANELVGLDNPTKNPMFGMHNIIKKLNIKTRDEVKQYSDFFKHLIPFSSAEENIFNKFSELICNQESGFPLNVTGDKGAGKSTFFAILYQTLKLSLGGTENVLYINFRRVEKNNENNLEDYLKEITTFSSINLQKKPIIILDDLDAIESSNETIYDFSERVIKEVANCKSARFVFGSKKEIEPGSLELIRGKLSPSFTEIPQLRNLNQRNAHYKNTIKSFTEICIPSMHENQKKQFNEKIKSFGAYCLDLFLLSTIQKKLEEKTYSSAKTLFEFLTRYCNTIIASQKSEPLDVIAKNVFNNFAINGADIRPPKNSNLEGNARKLWENPLIRDFLVAYHGVNQLLTFDEKNNKLNSFKFVFYDSINQFYKERICKAVTTQGTAIKKIEMLSLELKKAIMTNDGGIRNGYVRGLSHCVYLAGRLPDKKSTAQKLLKQILEMATEWYDNDEFQDSKSDLGLLLRSVYISLAYTGDTDATSDYVNRLIQDSEEDTLNRGFHLEYYRDQDYIASDGMNHKDQLENCDKTFSYLKKKINDHTTGKGDPLIQIEVYTAFSLVQNRINSEHYKVGTKKYKDIKIQSLELLNELKRSKIHFDADLNDYLKHIKIVLETENYQPFEVIHQIYGLKNLERSGWVKRFPNDAKGFRIESVAEHTFGACILAYFLLPEIILERNEEIRRSDLVELMLIHDVGESYVGDFIGKNNDEAIKEEDWIKHISFIGTNRTMPNLRELAKKFNSIENSLTILGKIASDFDRLENLVQLYLYKPYFDKIEDNDFDNFKQRLHSRIFTHSGKNTMAIIDKYFEKGIPSNLVDLKDLKTKYKYPTYK